MDALIARQAQPGNLLDIRREPRRLTSLPDPDEIAAEIVEDLRAALLEFEAIPVELSPTPGG